MAIDTISPAANNVLAPGDAFSFRVDDTYTSITVEVETAGGWEYAYDSSLSGAQAGYTVAVTVPTAGRHLFTVTRTAGWNLNPFSIRVVENETGTDATTTTNYYLSSQVDFPQGSDPYYGTYEGSFLVTDDNALVRNDVKWLNIDGSGYTLADAGNGKVTLSLTAAAGSGYAPVGEWKKGNNTIGFTAAGYFDVNNATPASVTSIRFNQLGDGTLQHNNWMADLAGGTLIFRDSAAPTTNAIVYDVTAVDTALAPTYYTFTVAYSHQVGTNWAATNYGVAPIPAGGGVAWGAITGTLSSQTDLQTALDAKVAGPASATDAAVALYDGTTGKLVKDSLTFAYASGQVDISSATSSLRMSERATGPTPGVAKGSFWVRNDTPSVPMFTDDAAGDTRLGDVVGPASATDSAVVLFNATGGKLVKDSLTLGYASGQLDISSATSSLRLSERTTGPTPGAGKGSFWVKDDAPSTPYFTNDAGTSYKIAPRVVYHTVMGRMGGPTTTNWYTSPLNESFDNDVDWDTVVGLNSSSTPVADYVDYVDGSIFTAPFAGTITNVRLSVRPLIVQEWTFIIFRQQWSGVGGTFTEIDNSGSVSIAAGWNDFDLTPASLTTLAKGDSLGFLWTISDAAPAASDLACRIYITFEEI